LVHKPSPFLTRIALREDRIVPGTHPFDLPLFQPGFEVSFDTPVTFLVGENGSGKSTLLEAIGWALGFNPNGGTRDHQNYGAPGVGAALGRALALTWGQRVAGGFFMRAETFFNFATHLEDVGSTFDRYGGRSLHRQSHGESFLALFDNAFEDGLYLLDEPEAALSPQRQLAFLRIIFQLATPGNAQFIIATHSPMLLAYPGATLLSLDRGALRRTTYQETEHYRITRDFLEAPERFFRHLLTEEEPPDA
jgi:predicted ATPase